MCKVAHRAEWAVLPQMCRNGSLLWPSLSMLPRECPGGLASGNALSCSLFAMSLMFELSSQGKCGLLGMFPKNVRDIS